MEAIGPNDEWIAARPELRQFLFGETDPGPYPDIEAMPLTALTLVTSLRGRSGYGRVMFDTVPVVGNILTYHDDQSELNRPRLKYTQPERPSSENALFGLPHREQDLPRLSALAGGMIRLWERVCFDHGRQQPFAELPQGNLKREHFERRDVQLVVETASAVCEVIQAGYPVGGEPGGSRMQTLARFLAKRGPQYAIAWLRGDIIRELCDSRGYSADEWLEHLPPSVRVNLALSTPDSLLAAAEEKVRIRKMTSGVRGGLNSVTIPQLTLPPAPVPAFRKQKTVNAFRQPDDPTPEREKIYQQWTKNRERYREELFGDTIDGQPSRDTQLYPSLASIALATTMGRTLAKEKIDLAERSELPRIIANILLLHDNLAHGEEDGLALFGVNGQKNLVKVIEHTAKVIWLWERICIRKNVSPLFVNLLNLPDDLTLESFKRQDVQLVVETASAVCEVIQAGFAFRGNIGTSEHSTLARLVAQRGPTFARRWVGGDIIREYCREHSLDAERWLSLVSPALRAEMALTHFRDPLGKLVTTIDNFDSVLTPENMQRATGWTQKRLEDAFPTGAKVRVAYHKDPLATLQLVTERIDKDLATLNMAAELGISPKEVDKIFTQTMRYTLARGNEQPIRAARRMLRLYTMLTQDYDIHGKLAARAAFEFRTSCVDRAIQVLSERPDRPRGVGPEMWDWLVMYFPNPGDKRRTDSIAALKLWWEIHFPRFSMDRNLYGGDSKRTLHDHVADQAEVALDPADIVGSDEPGDFLQGIAQRAGVSLQQLRGLLQSFAAGEDISGSSELLAALEKLKQSAARPREED
jgi:hypothetical protein